jgi:hypothetical protein
MPREKLGISKGIPAGSAWPVTHAEDLGVYFIDKDGDVECSFGQQVDTPDTGGPDPD